MSLALEHFLDTMVGEASLDSSGRFTLDISQAREKLAVFLLKRVDDLILKLVQCGVAGGADRIDFNNNNDFIRCTFRGLLFKKAELEEILQFLLRGDVTTNRALMHLAVAVNTGVATRPSTIVLASWDGAQGYLLHWSSKGKRIEPWSVPGVTTPLTLFQLTRTQMEWHKVMMHILGTRDIFGMLFGLESGWSEETRLLAKQAARTEIPVFVDGKRLPELPLVQVSRSFAGQEMTLPHTYVLPHTYELRLKSGLDSAGLRLTQHQVFPCPNSDFPEEPINVVMTAGLIPGEGKVRNYIELIYDGILVEKLAINGVPRDKYIRILAAVDASFKTALDGILLVDDKRHSDFCNWLLDQALVMWSNMDLGPLPQLTLGSQFG